MMKSDRRSRTGSLARHLLPVVAGAALMLSAASAAVAAEAPAWPHPTLTPQARYHGDPSHEVMVSIALP